MVRTRSREVAAISREVAPISVVVAAVSVAVACCCLEVAAISVTEVVTCTEERCAWDTSEVNSVIMSLKPVSTAPNSSLRSRFKRLLRSPVRMVSRIFTMRFIGAMIARISNRPQSPAANTATSSDTPMLIFAATTASSMAAVAWSATTLFSPMISLSFTRPAVQAGVSCSVKILVASASLLFLCNSRTEARMMA
ncbi:hypothetical protein D3C78_773300 [compost metagenome]